MTTGLSFSVLFFIASAAGIGLAIRIARDTSPPARELLGLALSVAEWAAFYGLEILARTAFYHELWSQFAYIGTHAAGAFLLRFSIRWLKPRLQGWWLQLIWVVPIVVVVAAFTNPIHGLVWPEIRPSENPAIWFYGRGPFFWVGVVFQYAAIGISVVLIIAAARVRKGIYRRQALHVVSGIVVAIVGNVVYLVRVIDFPLDVTPLALAISSGIFYTGISRNRMLDLLPAARHRVVDLMPDGLFILDDEYRIIDWNAAALLMWGVSGRDPTGTPVADVVPQWREQIERDLVDAPNEPYTTTLQIGGARNEEFVDVDIRRFVLSPHAAGGWVAMFRYATAIRKTQADLQEANERLEALNTMLLSQAIHDSLTGLFNRAYLDEALPRELARCRRDESTIALLILDVDHFKRVNDTYGHDIGDLVLREVARLVRGIVRAGDIPCRFGGDEIVAVMPGAPEPEVAGVAERIRQRVADGRFGDERIRLAVTVSIGFAIFPNHADSAADLFRAADRALYVAKDAGRDRVMAAPSHE